MTDKSAKIDTATLSPAERQLRQNIRNFLLTATREELEQILAAGHYPDEFSQRCIRELIAEC